MNNIICSGTSFRKIPAESLKYTAGIKANLELAGKLQNLTRLRNKNVCWSRARVYQHVLPYENLPTVDVGGPPPAKKKKAK